jgi:hypothetical protein
VKDPAFGSEVILHIDDKDGGPCDVNVDRIGFRIYSDPGSFKHRGSPSWRLPGVEFSAAPRAATTRNPRSYSHNGWNFRVEMVTRVWR